MTAEATRLHAADEFRFAHTAAVSRGEVILGPAGRTLIAADDYAADEEGNYYTEGVWELACATGTTFTAGDLVQWDVSANLAIAVGVVSGDFNVGRAIYGKASGPTVVKVLLNDHDSYAIA